MTFEYANGLTYKFETLEDGWIAIYEVRNGNTIPLIQVKDEAHARSFINLRERITVPFEVI